VNQSDPILILLTKTEDTTGTNRDTSITNRINRRQSLIVRSGSNDRGVKLPRSIEIMVVCAQPSILESDCLFRRKHSQGSTDYHQLDLWNPLDGDSPSIPIPLTSVTIFKIFSKPDFLPAKSLHAAPIQNRVEPFALASRAASNTGSISINLEAFVGVL
jgi:hypothetical protein